MLCPGFVRTNIFTSQRNRPDALKVAGRGPMTAARAANVEMVRLVEALAIPPEEVAEAVLGAVLEDRFWILTHPELLEAIDERHAALLADRR